jgi:short-subunit dehydrogenase
VSPASSKQLAHTILIVAASRSLGYAMAAEFLKKGWNVIGTARAGTRTKLHDLAEAHEDRVEIETLEINERNQIATLRNRLSGRVLGMLFVNAGTFGRRPIAGRWSGHGPASEILHHSNHRTRWQI